MAEGQSINKNVTSNPQNAVKFGANRDSSVGDTILQQFGGNRFIVMTGARNIYTMKNGLQFDIGRNGSRANRVRVTLNGDDTYTMQFIRKGRDVNPYTIGMRYLNQGLSADEFNAKVKAATEKAQRNAEAKVLKEYKGVYFDQLQSLFTEYTGLRTRL